RTAATRDRDRFIVWILLSLIRSAPKFIVISPVASMMGQRRMIGLALLTAALLDDSWAPPRSMTLEESPSGVDLRVDAGAWLVFPTGWVLITRGSEPGSGDHMDIGSDVHLHPTLSPVVEGVLTLNSTHGFGLRFSRIDASGTGTADGTFIYHGDVYDAGRRV